MEKNDQSSQVLDQATNKPRRFRQFVSACAKFILIAVVGSSGVLAVLYLALLAFHPRMGPRYGCYLNLRLIGTAINQYVNKYGRLPPAYTVDAEGNRLHSWRTLILPYLDEQNLYNSIDLSKPWYDPVNREAFQHGLRIYRCPGGSTDRNLTHYLAVIDERSCFPPGKSVSYSEMKDGSSNTILVVEVNDEAAVPWMSPQDLDASLLMQIDPKAKHHHADGFQVLFADGQSRFISRDLNKSTLRALVTKDAGDSTDNF